MKDKKEKSTAERLAERTEGFLGSNRKLLVIILIVILLAVAGVAIGVNLHGRQVSDNYEELYNLEESYNSLMLLDETTEEFTTSLSEFEGNVDVFVADHDISTYLGARATMLLAEVRFMQEDWESAYQLYLAVAEAHRNDYLGPLGYTNAAVAAENNANKEEALRLYTLIWDNYGNTCAEAPQALFNQARLEYENGNEDIARSIFEQLTTEFPNSYYTSIARTWLLTY